MSSPIQKYKEQCSNFLNSNSTEAKMMKVILVTVALSGVILIAAIAPNIGIVCRQFKAGKRFSNRQYYQSLYALKRKGYIDFKDDQYGKRHIFLNPKGQAKTNTILLENISIPKQKRWDGLWRIISYDLPIRFKKGREGLRYKIKDLGFVQLQKSVWVYPYPCEKEITEVAEFWGVSSHVTYIEGTIKNDSKLRNHFKI